MNLINEEYNDNDDGFSDTSFDDSWIDEYLNEEKKNTFEELDFNTIIENNSDSSNNININNDYTDCIKVYFLYVEKDPGTLTTINYNVISSVRTKYIYFNNFITKEHLIEIIKNFSYHENIKYKLLNILKYENYFTNKDLEALINNTYNNKCHKFLTVIKNIDDIFINKSTLKLLSPLSCIYFIFSKIQTKEQFTVTPSLKIPYFEKKCHRKTRTNKKYHFNKSLKQTF
jgi:hypothetical protein